MKKKLSFAIDVIIFGSIWGILEATLGTLLHFPLFDKAGIFAASSTIMVPIAYCLMAMCYKRTNKLSSVVVMGIIASALKLMVGFIVGFRSSVINPAIYIILESLSMFGALAIFRPKNVLSLKTLATVIVANTFYQFSYLLVNMAMGGTNIFASQKAWEKVGEYHLFTINAVAILYVFAAGSIAYGISKVLEAKHVEFKFDYKRIVYSPITASVMLSIAVVSTITFAAIL